MYAFTRHPKALVRVIVLELRACARWVLGILLTYADREGKCWVQVPELLRLAKRSPRRHSYSKASILRSLRELRQAGLLTWERVPPGEAFPGRSGKEGRKTECGGRVWTVNLPALRGERPAGIVVPCDGMESGGVCTDRSPMIDRRSIMHDRSSDPLCLPPEDKMDHGLARSARASATPTKDDSETPGAAQGGTAPSRVQVRVGAPTIDGETPGASARAAAPSVPTAPAPPRPIEAKRAQEGDGRGGANGGRKPATAGVAPMSAAERREAWAAIAAAGILRDGPAVPQNRAKNAPQSRPAPPAPWKRQAGD